jgi:archaemetzincin
MYSILLPLALAIASATGAFGIGARPVVAIQQFGPLGDGVVERVKSGIERQYDVEVVVLPAADLPPSAYYSPRRRYRADRLLDVLDGTARDRYTKIVGLTASDISTSTDEHADWGVYGLGELGGAPCVVSTHRLARGRASDARFAERLVRAVNHELGHTFGVDHCPVETCLMADALGTMRRVDGGSGSFCAACSARLAAIRANPNTTP